MIQIVFQRRYEEVALETQLHRARRVVNIQLIIGWALRIVPIIIVRLPSERRFRDARAIRLVRRSFRSRRRFPSGGEAERPRFSQSRRRDGFRNRTSAVSLDSLFPSITSSIPRGLSSRDLRTGLPARRSAIERTSIRNSCVRGIPRLRC